MITSDKLRAAIISLTDEDSSAEEKQEAFEVINSLCRALDAITGDDINYDNQANTACVFEDFG